MPSIVIFCCFEIVFCDVQFAYIWNLHFGFCSGISNCFGQLQFCMQEKCYQKCIRLG
ncbi:hypothetical protein RHGRI_016761 [Rhododendron griersonianum]|uniref:Uncharacterized protein n=1 Tax=Rhododendron griersonianum TaxID=479676 RepID=A0AAV6JV97_9ERIC|nr:hypothetical protein RHGRI_016761 [Rhododendron griersonianum]